MILNDKIRNAITSKTFRRVIDVVGSPLTILGGTWLKYFRSRDVDQMPVTKLLLNKIGVFPVNDHYYEPLFNFKKHLHKPLNKNRYLQGININEEEQLDFLKSFHYQEELIKFPLNKTSKLEYYYENGSFLEGDAEYAYSLIRKVKPQKIIEIGCGFSTLIMANALQKNRDEDAKYECAHICVEPYEMPWLEQLGIQVIRNKVESLPLSFFSSLDENDILFIDSSHMIRPQGDVLFEFLEILPVLKIGVYIHVHDIFTPNDYPEKWLKDLNRFWNEQYLAEAFLSFNSDFKIVGALNFLRHHHFISLGEKLPMLAQKKTCEPGSLWLQRI